jgi:hypothetical protein
MTQDQQNSDAKPTLAYADVKTRNDVVLWVPLASGFVLLALGLLTLIMGPTHVEFGSEGLTNLVIVVVSLVVIGSGLIVIFRCLRRFDW